MVKIRHCMEFEVVVAGEASGRGNLQGKCLAVAPCPSEVRERKLSDERCKINGRVANGGVIPVDESHRLSSREDHVVESEVPMNEGDSGWGRQSENVHDELVRQGLELFGKHGYAFFDKVGPAVSATPGANFAEGTGTRNGRSASATACAFACSASHRSRWPRPVLTRTTLSDPRHATK